MVTKTGVFVGEIERARPGGKNVSVIKKLKLMAVLYNPENFV